MAFLTIIEAAIKLGYSPELVNYFGKKCPKHGDNRVLKITKGGEFDLIDETDLIDYQNYLNKPWPLTEKGKRPNIPEAIKDDIRQESNHSCAICGHAENGEIAHIEEVSKTKNNSPDNLIYLCPNHHSKYDYGFKPASNITLEEVNAAKLIRRNCRRRILRYESNATKSLKALIERVAKIERSLGTALTETHRQINTTELPLCANISETKSAG